MQRRLPCRSEMQMAPQRAELFTAIASACLYEYERARARTRTGALCKRERARAFSRYLSGAPKAPPQGQRPRSSVPGVHGREKYERGEASKPHRGHRVAGSARARARCVLGPSLFLFRFSSGALRAIYIRLVTEATGGPHGQNMSGNDERKGESKAPGDGRISCYFTTGSSDRNGFLFFIFGAIGGDLCVFCAIDGIQRERERQ